MGCNCKTVRNLDYITKKYGDNAPVSKSSKVIGVTKNFFKGILIWIIMILLFPVLIILIPLKKIFFKNKGFKISKYLKINF